MCGNVFRCFRRSAEHSEGDSTRHAPFAPVPTDGGADCPPRRSLLVVYDLVVGLDDIILPGGLSAGCGPTLRATLWPAALAGAAALGLIERRAGGRIGLVELIEALPDGVGVATAERLLGALEGRIQPGLGLG